MKPSEVVKSVKGVATGIRPPTWVVVVALGVLLLLIVIAAIWLLRRKKGRDEGAAAAAAPPETDGGLGKEVAAAWARFVRALPRKVRRSLGEFHPVVVLGTEASGKGTLIERFSGVELRRGELGAPAELTDAPLRLHLGADKLVLELSEDACRARMDTIDRGLRRVLGPLLRRRAPVVLVCVSPETLEKRAERDLGELGAALRAKIDLIAELRGEPVEVRVAMPDLPGNSRFDALFRLTALPGVPSVLPFDDVSEPALRARLLAFTDLFSEALVAQEALETLATVDFLTAVPRLSQALASLFGELFSAKETAATPRPDGLYLIPPAAGPNPFTIPERLARPAPHPLLKHRLIALSAAGLAAAWILGGYRRHAASWTTAENAILNYDVEKRDEEHLRKQVLGYAQGEPSEATFDLVLPRFFIPGPDTVGCAFVEKLRQGPLRDEMTDLICRSTTKASAKLATACGASVGAEPAAPEELLYRLALLYAHQENDLTALVHQGREQWAAVSLTVPIIDDYLALARPNRDVSLLEELWSYSYDAEPGVGFAALFDFLAPLASIGKPGTVVHTEALLKSAAEVRALLKERVRFGYAAEVVDSQAFHQKPLESYTKVFARYRARLELLSELSERRADLEKVLDAVEAGSPGEVTSAPRTLPALVERLSALLDERRDSNTFSFDLAGKSYEVDLKAVGEAFRDTRLREVIDGFTDGAEPDHLLLLGFKETDLRAEVNLRARWPEGIGAKDLLARPYTREGFEKAVKPNLLALEKLLGHLEHLPTQRNRLERIVAGAVEHYAADYAGAIDGLYASVRLGAMGAVGLKRVMRELAGAGSPLKDFLDDIAHHSALGLDKGAGLLRPFLAMETKYAPIAKVIDTAKGGGALVAYQDILRDAVLRLDPTAAAPGTDGQAELFAANLSPLARIAFTSLADPKSAPLELARSWTLAQRLDDDLARPFLDPLERLRDQAGAELGKALTELNRGLVRSLEIDLFTRYPFNLQAMEEVDPDDLDAWLNPKRGRVVREILASVGPLIHRTPSSFGGRAYAAGTSCAGEDACAHGIAPLLGTVNDLARVTSLLWSEDGKVQPLRVRVLPHPFQMAGEGAPRPIALRLIAGEGHVDYFNQKPAEALLELDWTKRQTSALSVDLSSSGPVKSFDPPAIVVSGTPWSFFRLLQKARKEGGTRIWRLPAGDSDMVNVALTVRESVTDTFRAGAGLADESPLEN